MTNPSRPVRLLLLAWACALACLSPGPARSQASYVPSQIGDIAKLGRSLNFGGKLRTPVVFNRSRVTNPPNTPLSSGTAASSGAGAGVSGGTYRLAFTAMSTCYDVQLLFANITGDGNNGLTQAGPDAITVKVSFEGAFSQLLPVTFPGGQRTVTLAPFGKILTNPFPMTFTAGQTYYFRVFVTAVGGAGHKYPLCLPEIASDSTTDNGTDNSDVSDGPFGYAFPLTGLSGSGFGPIAIYGQQTVPAASIFVTGDSIPNGAGETVDNGQNNGFLMRAIGPLFGVFRNTVSGATGFSLNLFSPENTAGASGQDYAIDEFGINDLFGGTSLAAMKTNAIKRWGDYAQRGCRVYATTILQSTASTDSWATLGNQYFRENSPTVTQTALVDATHNPVEFARRGYNQWLRAPASAGAGNSARYDAAGVLYGVIDSALPVELNADGSHITINPATGATNGTGGGFWPVNGSANYPTMDGTHPTTPMVLLMTPTVPTVWPVNTK